MRRAITDEIPRLRRHARALVRDPKAADDLVQDCLETAVSRIESWTSGHSPRRQLYTIMHQLLVDHLPSTNRVDAEVLMSKTIDAVAAPARRPEEIASVEVLAALQQIAPERRAALTLVAVEGLSYAEAANVLGIARRSLASRIARGRQDLRSILEDVLRRKMTLSRE